MIALKLFRLLLFKIINFRHILCTNKKKKNNYVGLNKTNSQNYIFYFACMFENCILHI